MKTYLPLLGAYLNCILLAMGLATMPSFLPSWLYTAVAVLILLAVGGTVAYTVTYFRKDD